MDNISSRYFNDTFSLAGKKVLVTGGGRGLGMAFSISLAQAGADIVLVSRTSTELEETAEKIRGFGRKAFVVTADLTKENDVKEMADAINNVFGHVDILINNAGIGSIVGSIAEMSLSDWQLVMDTNVTSIFLCSKAIIPLMKNKERKGKIINISSMYGLVVNRYLEGGAYCTSKFAVIGLTKALASDLAPYNITVNAIAPGFCRTKPNENFFHSHPELYEKLIDMIPLQRICEPKELSGLAVYLSSEASDFMTGSVLVIDGGYTIW